MRDTIKKQAGNPACRVNNCKMEFLFEDFVTAFIIKSGMNVETD